MSLQDAQTAEQHAKIQAASAAATSLIVAQEKCTQQHAPNVVDRQKFLSYRVATSQYTAQNASRSRETAQAAAAGNCLCLMDYHTMIIRHDTYTNM